MKASSAPNSFAWFMIGVRIRLARKLCWIIVGFLICESRREPVQELGCWVAINVVSQAIDSRFFGRMALSCAHTDIIMHIT